MGPEDCIDFDEFLWPKPLGGVNRGIRGHGGVILWRWRRRPSESVECRREQRQHQSELQARLSAVQSTSMRFFRTWLHTFTCVFDFKNREASCCLVSRRHYRCQCNGAEKIRSQLNVGGINAQSRQVWANLAVVGCGVGLKNKEANDTRRRWTGSSSARRSPVGLDSYRPVRARESTQPCMRFFAF